MKRTLVIVAAALIFISTLVVPTVAHADGQPGGGNCSGMSACKP